MRFPIYFLTLLALACTATTRAAEEKSTPPSANPVQLNLEIRLIEMEQTASKAVGFDWYLGNIHPQDKANSAPEGTAPQLQATPQQPIPTQNRSQGIATVTGILTDPQFQTVVRALGAREGATTLIAANIPATAGTPVKLERPDGWRVELLPTLSSDGDLLLIDFALTQTKGEYEGFHISSRITLKQDQVALFSDTLTPPNDRKDKKSQKQKRLILSIDPQMN